MVKWALPQLKMTNVHCLRFGDQAKAINELPQLHENQFSSDLYVIQLWKLKWTKQRELKSNDEDVLREGNTDWLRTTIKNFVKTQPGWNSNTILITAITCKVLPFIYNNDSRTNHANSIIVSWTAPTNQTGKHNPKYLLELQVTVVSSSCWLMISTTQTQRFKLSSWLHCIHEHRYYYWWFWVKASMFSVMPWIMSMWPSSRLLNTS